MATPHQERDAKRAAANEAARQNKLCLGTVQLGMEYGIKNELGRRPTPDESFAILEEALRRGVDAFDTAAAYGDAEKILGEFGIGRYPVDLISKVHFTREERAGGDLGGVMAERLCRTLENLRVARLDGYLLHTAADFYNEEVLAGLRRLKDEKLAAHIGVSVYDRRDAVAAVKSGVVDYIQIPYNVWDQRLECSDFFAAAKRRHVKVFARSSFLQGLLLMDAGQAPGGLAEAADALRAFEAIAAAHSFTRREAALLFSYTHGGIDKVVVGVDTAGQLAVNFRAVARAGQFERCREALKDYFRRRKISEKTLNPSLWK